MEYNYEVVNTHSQKSKKIKYENNQKWKNYSQRITCNPYVKQYLIDKYDGICQYCGLPIKDEFVIQHKTYDKECTTDTTIEISHPTPKRPNKIRHVPDCENCYKFHECVDDALYPVHKGCNFLISKETYKIATGYLPNVPERDKTVRDI